MSSFLCELFLTCVFVVFWSVSLLVGIRDQSVVLSLVVWVFLTCFCGFSTTTITTTNVMDYSAANHIVAGALYKNLDLKLLHSSMQTSADYRSRRRHVSRVTDEKGETWSPSGMSKVRSRPESVVADCSMHALAAATGKARSPRVARRVDGTCSVMVSAERRHRRPRSLMS